MKTCQDVAGVLTDYLEGQLPAPDAAALRAHITDCPACEAFIKSFQVASEATREALLQQIPGDFESRLKSFLGARLQRK